MILAYLKLFLHCLFYFHKSEELYINKKLYFLGCKTCGKVFWEHEYKD